MQSGIYTLIYAYSLTCTNAQASNGFGNFAHYYLFVRQTTLSTWDVWGNISTGWIFVAL